MTESLDDNQKSIIEDVVQRFVDAQLRGEQPDIEEFVKKHPSLEQQIRENIRDLQKIEGLFDTIVLSDSSNCDHSVTGEELIDRKVGNFQIVQVIGRGGMGVVYLARDTKLDRSVAVKSMSADLVLDSTARLRFEREAKLLASLNHPNIAIIHEIFEEGESGYLILEYVPGETLADRMACGPLKLQEALSIGQQIAEAVSAAHEKGVVHRDLKPGNIKITPEGRVKVLDFGLAKVSGGQGRGGKTTITQPGRVMGTPAYMSPEQARGKDTDHRTDIWSFGCIVFEMLTGSAPFEGETAADTLVRIIEREPDWGILPESTPTNIRALIRRCLAKEPRRRLQHIGDAAIEISETLNLPKTAPPDTTPSSYSFEQKRTAGPLWRTVIITTVTVIIVVVCGAILWSSFKKHPEPFSGEIRLVVLPFENLGSTEDEYFADGITDAITARLAGLNGLGVISRQSAMQYKNREKHTRQIAEELGVDYILEGTVQREWPSEPASRVRIIPQLVRASDDVHVWAQVYDDDMSEMFRLQSDLAEQVAQTLNITLLEPERQALKTKPTENMEAYDYYLRGNDYLYRGYLENDLKVAIRMYDKAVGLDPSFVLAYTQLSRAHSWMYWFHYHHGEERLTMARRAVDKALQLDPDLPEAHVALGHYYYHCHLDYDRALEQFAIARRSQPNSNEHMKFIGFVQRRQGKFQQALTNIKKASELDPLSNTLVFEVALTLMLQRRYQQAETYYERAISMTPDFPEPYSWMAWLYLLWQGRTEKAHAVFERASENIGSVESHWIIFRSVVLDVFDGNYQEALSRLSSYEAEAFDTQFWFVPKAQLYAQINGLMGNRQLEKDYYDSARSVLGSKIQEDPNDARFRSALGIAYAGLGRKVDAIREGELATALLPVTKDAWRGAFRVEDLARIYVMVGEFNAAIDQLKYLLSIPGEMSIPLLQLDPIWDPLRDHPRFKELFDSAK
jgi:serine/threonine-protein kinase